MQGAITELALVTSIPESKASEFFITIMTRLESLAGNGFIFHSYKDIR
jgi:hypothetical protein